jgi:hypothetical protein
MVEPVLTLQERVCGTRPDFSHAALLRMAHAAATAVDCMDLLHRSGSNVVAEALRDHGEFVEWEHYPPNDARDPQSHAQFYFHAHSLDDRDEPDYGHFHTFMRQCGMPPRVRPAQVRDYVAPAEENAALSHLIAISMSPAGMPVRLFTTNRWVTSETWYRAEDTIAMLDGFTIDGDSPSPVLNRWITAMLVVFRSQIEDLLLERDRVINHWQAEHPQQNVFEDRRLDIVSSIEISLYERIKWLDRQLDVRKLGDA